MAGTKQLDLIIDKIKAGHTLLVRQVVQSPPLPNSPCTGPWEHEPMGTSPITPSAG